MVYLYSGIGLSPSMSLDHTPIKLHAVYTGTNGKRKKEVKNDRKIKIEKAQLSAFVMANPARRHQTYKANAGKSFRSRLGETTNIATSNPIRHPKLRGARSCQGQTYVAKRRRSNKEETQKEIHEAPGFSPVVEIILTKTLDNVAAARAPPQPSPDERRVPCCVLVATARSTAQRVL